MQANAQVSQFRKSVLDSIKPHTLYGLGALTFSFNKDSKSNLFLISDLQFMYSGNVHTYEVLSSLNFNSNDNISTANRFYTMFRAGLWRGINEKRSHLLKKQRLYAEPFVFFQWDENRGISQRWQYGLNAVYVHKYDAEKIKWNVGLGLLYEKEDWRVLSRELFPIFDTLPPLIKERIIDVLHIDARGHLQRDNYRINAYANFTGPIGQADLNIFVGVQQPLSPPFKGLPDLAYYSFPKKCYPRITIDGVLAFKITRHASLITRFYLQSDKGQLTHYVPDLVYTISEGISLAF